MAVGVPAGDVWVTVGVGTLPVVVCTMSSGRLLLASRLLKFITLGLVVVIARSYTPLPLTRDVTSTLTQLPEEKLPDEPITGPTAGAFAYVIELSSQFCAATRWT